MATLQQTLRGLPSADTQTMRGPGGVLQQKKTLQQATQQAGLQAAPLTPMAAQTLGASPDAAKMAGTPQQVKSALEQAAAPQQPLDLQTALRQKQYQRAATPEEMERLTKSASMQTLGGLGDRVTNMVKAEKKKVDTVEKIDVPIVAEYLGKSTEPIKETLKKLRDKPDDMTLQKAVADYFGKVLSTDEINSLFVPQAEAITGAAAAAIGPTEAEAPAFTLADMAQDPEFGYTIPQLAQLLEVPETALAGYTVEDLQARINQIQAQEFEQAKQLEATAVSPLTGAAERQLAQEAARELSSIGITATEADIQNLTNDIASANMVTFGNEQMTYEQALSDENISNFIKAYLEAPAGSQTRKDMETAEPTLTAFANKHATVLTQAAANLGAGVTQFGTLQSENKALISNLLGNVDIDPTVLEDLVPGSTKFSDVKLEAKSSPILNYLETKEPDQRKKFTTELNTIKADNPNIGKEVAKLTPEQLSNLNIENNGKRWKLYKNTLDDYKTVSRLESDDTAELLRNYSATLDSPEQVNTDIENNKIMTNLGFGDTTYNTGTLPIVNEKVDTAKLKDTFLANNPEPTVADAADGKTKVAAFNYKSPAVPSPGSSKERVLQYWSDFGRSGTVPTFEQIKQRLADTDANIFDLADSGTLGKWGINYNELFDYLVSDLKINFDPTTVSVPDLDLGNLPNFQIRL